MMSFFRPSGPAPAAIDPQDAVQRVQDGSLTLLDIRDHNELQMSGRAAGATHIPLMVLPMKANPSSPELHPELSTEKPVAVYCASGARSHMAVQLMQQMGYREVYNLGGLHHWQMAGGAITQ